MTGSAFATANRSRPPHFEWRDWTISLIGKLPGSYSWHLRRQTILIGTFSSYADAVQRVEEDEATEGVRIVDLEEL
jgi:hypothetical protein